MDELIKALTAEQTHAAAAMKEAEEKGEHYQGAYWEGYQDAINNAAALIYGPTPLEQEPKEFRPFTFWVADDGSTGSGEVLEFDTSNWTVSDWLEFDETTDDNRLQVAKEINHRRNAA